MGAGVAFLWHGIVIVVSAGMAFFLKTNGGRCLLVVFVSLCCCVNQSRALASVLVGDESSLLHQQASGVQSSLSGTVSLLCEDTDQWSSSIAHCAGVWGGSREQQQLGHIHIGAAEVLLGDKS